VSVLPGSVILSAVAESYANVLSDVFGVPAVAGLPAYTLADWEARPEWYKLAGQHDPADPVYASWFGPGQPVLPFSARAPLPGETVPGETVCGRALFPSGATPSCTNGSPRAPNCCERAQPGCPNEWRAETGAPK